VATGRTRVEFDEEHRFRLLRGVDGAGSVLFSGADARISSRTLFRATDQAGGRAHAERRSATVAGKPDSHEICFVPDGGRRLRGTAAGAR
jgi:tRNA U34 2-thiouridine synthase MnmA/TrmU